MTPAPATMPPPRYSEATYARFHVGSCGTVLDRHDPLAAVRRMDPDANRRPTRVSLAMPGRV